MNAGGVTRVRRILKRPSLVGEIALALGAAAALLAYASYLTTQWGGSCGYGQGEYELTFEDASGSPVEGVELKVEDERGDDFFCFPVTDYLPGHAPVSDQYGVMRFHHVSTGVEWDNYGWELFWLVPVQKTRSPVFICRFVLQGKEVYRIPYAELERWDWEGRTGEQVPKVTRQWSWPAMTPAEIAWQPSESEDHYVSRTEQFFHIDRNGKRHREGSIARRNACRRFDTFGPAVANKAKPVEDELEFPVIRRKITVEPPVAASGQ
jgi:hypothetical protein